MTKRYKTVTDQLESLEERAMNRWKALFIPSLVVVALALGACTSAETPTEEPAPAATEAAPDEHEDEHEEPAPSEPIKIGMLTDLTSTFAPWGVQVRDGC